MPGLALSCTLAEDKENSSQETDWNIGSAATYEQTSVNSFDVKSLISLSDWRHHLRQDRTRLIEDNPQVQCAGV